MAVRRLWRVLVAGIPLGGVSVLFLCPRRAGVAALVVAGALGCRESARQREALRDDFGDSIHIGAAPTRIVSLSPSSTEILFAIGAGNRVVGRSKFDLWPDSARLVPDLGDGIRPNVEAVLGARPDLVILYASQENRAAADRFRAAGINTLSLKMDQIAEFRRMTRLFGLILHDAVRAQSVVDSVQATLDRVRRATAASARPKVFWHIWDSPLITVGAGSFMNELVDIAGGRNIYADIHGPSGQIALEDVARRDPDFILAGPVGAARIEADSRWRIVRAARDHHVIVVDTGLVARPSVRLGEAAVSLAKALHPGIAP